MAEDRVVMEQDTGLRRSKRNKYHLDVAAMLKSGSSMSHRGYSPPRTTKKWATQRPNSLINQHSKVSPNKRYVKNDETSLKCVTETEFKREEMREKPHIQEFNYSISSKFGEEYNNVEKLKKGIPEPTEAHIRQTRSVSGGIRSFDIQLPEQLLEEDNFDSSSTSIQKEHNFNNNNSTNAGPGPAISIPAVLPQRQVKRQRKVPLRHLDYTNEESDVDEDMLFKSVKVEYTLTDGIRTVDEHSCSKCPAIFESRVGLTNHFKLHGAGKDFPCELCDFSCTNKKTMRQHRRVHGLIKKQRTKSTRHYGQLNVPNLEVAPKTDCTNNLNQNDEIKNEQIDEEEMEEGEEKFIVVKSFVNVPDNSAHYADSTMPILEEQKFAIPKAKCNTKTNSRIKRQRPRDTKKSRDLPVGFYKKGSRIYDRNTVRCPHCPFRTQSKIRLEPHLLGHTRETGFECSICQFKSESSGFLRRHCQLHLPSDFKWPPDYVGNSDSNISANTPTITCKQRGYHNIYDITETQNMPITKEQHTGFNNFLNQGDFSFDNSKANVLVDQNVSLRDEKYIEEIAFSTNINNMYSHYLKNRRNKLMLLKSSLLTRHIYKFTCIRCGLFFPFTFSGMILHKLRHHIQKNDARIKLCRELLAEHIVLKSENVQDICFSDKITTNVSVEKKYISVDLPKVFNCPHCPYTTAQVFRLQKHENKHYIKADQQCSHCSFSCRSLDILLQHLRLHENGNNSNSILDEQILAVQPNTDQIEQFNDDILSSIRKNETLFCQYCPYKSKHNCDMKAHLKMHEERRKYTCSYCTYSTMRQNALIAHEKLHQNNGIIKGAASRRINNIYFKQNNGKRRVLLGAHMQHLHNGIYFYRCFVKKCAAEFTYCSELAQHARHHQSDNWSIGKNLGCTICGFKTSIEKRIRVHQAVHKGEDDKNVRSVEGVFYCKSCPFLSANYAKFWNHCQKHKRSARFACTFCSFSTGSTQCYSEHLKLHNKDSIEILQNFTNKNTELDQKGGEFIEMPIKVEEHIKVSQPCDELPVFRKDKYEKLSALLPVAQLKMLKKIGKGDAEESESSSTSTSSVEKSQKCCSECPYKTDDSVLLKLHFEMHYSRSPRPFACTLCTFSCFSAESLHTHLTLHSSTTSIKDKLQQQNNQAISRNGHYFHCSQCNYFKTTDMEMFLIHRKEHVQLLQQRLMTIIKRSATETIGISNEFKDKSKLMRGWRSTDKQHFCLRCSFRCDSVQAFTQHWEHHKTNQLRQGIFKCTICDYNSDSKNVVTFHEKNHHLDVPLKSLSGSGSGEY